MNNLKAYLKELNEHIEVNEAITVNAGAEFIGNAYGFDVFVITTWAGAQQFVNDENEEPAGVTWMNSEASANANLSAENPVYFFAKEDTNRVVAAAMKRRSGTAAINISGHLRDTFAAQINYDVEDVSGSTGAVFDSTTQCLPFYLLPGFVCSNHVNGLLIKNNKLVNNFKGFVPQEATYEEVIITDPITKINSYALSGVNYINNLVIPAESVVELKQNAIEGFSGRLCVRIPEEEKPATWEINSSDITWNYGIDPEEAQRRSAEARAAASRAERERQAAQMSASQALKYEIKKDHVVIVGANRSKKKIKIPSEIEGKPVTEIAPYAFYKHKNLKLVYVPSSVTVIGRAAFYGCENADVRIANSVSKMTVFPDALSYVSDYYYDANPGADSYYQE